MSYDKKLQNERIGMAKETIKGLLWCGYSGECRHRVPCYVIKNVEDVAKSMDGAEDEQFICDILHKYANKHITITIMEETYYQPEYDEKSWCEKGLHSFEVYRSLENAERDFPSLKINKYTGEDIENHVYVD